MITVVKTSGQPSTFDDAPAAGSQWLPASATGAPILATVAPSAAVVAGTLTTSGTAGKRAMLSACFTAFVAATVNDTSPLATFELQVDGVPLPVPVNTVSSIAAQQIPAGGRAGYFIQVNLTGVYTFPDALPHTFTVVANAFTAQTTILVGSDAPLAVDGNLNLWRNVP